MLIGLPTGVKVVNSTENINILLLNLRCVNFDTEQIYFVSDNYRIIAIIGTLKPANVHVGQELFGKIVDALHRPECNN